MSEFHFRNLDLNLLRVFDALIEERSVTRAADTLGLTQSAVSHALGRLRDVLGDPLFVRRSGGIEPTPRALEIGPGLHTALAHLQDALSPPGFDPSTTERRFTLAAGPYACATLIPALVERLRQTAPHVELQIEAYGPDPQESLDAGRIDAAIISPDGPARRFKFVPLFTETMVWVAAPDHPLAQGELTEARLAASRRISISGFRDLVEAPVTVRRPPVQPGEALPPPPPPASVTAPDSISAVMIVARSDMIALAPRRLAQMAMETGRVILREPLAPTALQIGALFRLDRLSQPALNWFARTLKAVGEGV